MSEELALWRAYRRTRDPGLRDQLLERHLGVVRTVAAWVAGRLPAHLARDDLYAAGLVGFLAALEDYDPELGVDFPAYAARRVRGAIFDELRRLDWVPRGVRRRLREAERAMDRLARRLGREPTDEEVAAELGLPLTAYHDLLGQGVTLVSLDSAAGEEAEPWGERLEDPTAPDPLLTAAADERRRVLATLVERLPERERLVLALYYVEELTMREVGEVLGVTESRVSQLHASAILRLRSALRRTPGALAALVPAGAPRPRGRRS